MSEGVKKLLDGLVRTRWRNTIYAITTVLLSTAVFGMLLLFAGKNPLTTLAAIVEGGFGSGIALKESLTRSTPLLLCALAAAIPARAGIFNIGGEGQLHLGAIAATFVALNAGNLPAVVVVPLMLLAAMLAGSLWAAVPGTLKSLAGVNEVLVGLMLNYVAIYLVEHLVHGIWKDQSALGWPYSASFPDSAILPTLGNSNIHLGLFLGILVALGLFFAIRRTTWGFRIRVIESSPSTARYLKLPIGWMIVGMMILGGACAALAGVGEVSVIQGRLRPGISPGYGYAGFIVAWLAGRNFLAIIPVAFLVGGLYSGSDAIQLTAGLPSSTIDIFMGLVFLAFLFNHHFAGKHQPGGPIQSEPQA